ncbi:hypothetical protein NXS19_009105 [Fusarium pseudograminearum]|nr:hypothetical protein NXS19_009105 [Fusarium pseudograminearum]
MAGINLRDRLPSRRVMLPGISSTRGLTIAHLLRQNTAKLILRPVTCRYLCLLPLKASQNLGIMAPKQATLGYVKSGQSTIGKFFGAKNASAPQQTKLSFSTKPKKEAVKQEEEEEEEEEADAKVQSSPGSDKETKKRTRSKKTEPEPTQIKKEEIDDDSDGPVTKRARRTRKRVEEDEDDEMIEEPVEKKESVSPKKSKSSSPPPKSPKKPKAKSKAKPKAKAVKEPIPEETPESASEEASIASASEAEGEEDVDEKPEVAAKAREKAQTKFKTKANDPYPDWQPGTPVPYAALCTTFSLVEMTTKRLIIMEHCSLFLRQVMRLTPDDLLPTVLLMINKLAPDYAGIELGIGESLIMKAIGETTGRSLQVIKADQKDIGDLGLVAVKSRSTQRTMFKPKPLTVRGIHQGLMNIATVTGNGAQGRKVDGIKKLLAAADANSTGKVDITKDKGGPSEAKFIIRFLEGKLRLGLAERTVLVSLAQAIVAHEAYTKDKAPSATDLEKGEAILKTVYSELPSYDVIIPAILEHGIMKLRDTCKLRPGVPLKPMLAKPTKAITEVLDRFEGQKFTCEYKYDGERAQIHYVAKDAPQELNEASQGAAKEVAAGVASIFSRNSEDLSRKYPDILAKLHTWVKLDTKSFVLDCETVAWDVDEKKVLPFQQLMTRKKKDVKVEDVKVKVCVFAFDLLYLNGEAVVEKALRERRELLQTAFNPVEGEFAFATHMDGQELDEIQVFLDESVKASCEGLMVKMLDGMRVDMSLAREVATGSRSRRTISQVLAIRWILLFSARTMARASVPLSMVHSFWPATTPTRKNTKLSATLEQDFRSRFWKTCTSNSPRSLLTGPSPSTHTLLVASISLIFGSSLNMCGRSRQQT